MTDKTALRQLIEAVEAGKWSNGKTQNFGVLHHMGLDAARAYNGYLDAAKALHDALLPGWQRCISDEANYKGFVAHVSSPDAVQCFTGHAKSDSRAWLIAVLKALEAQ